MVIGDVLLRSETVTHQQVLQIQEAQHVIIALLLLAKLYATRRASGDPEAVVTPQLHHQERRDR